MKYFFLDNWSGTTRQFPSLRAAKKAAKKQTGTTVSIIEIGTNKVIFTPASGHTPA